MYNGIQIYKNQIYLVKILKKVNEFKNNINVIKNY